MCPLRSAPAVSQTREERSITYVQFCLAMAMFLIILKLLSFDAGTLEVTLIGCQGLLESVPGRSRNSIVQLPAGSLEGRAGWIKGSSKSYGKATNKYNVKPDDLSSKYILILRLQINQTTFNSISEFSTLKYRKSSHLIFYYKYNN